MVVLLVLLPTGLDKRDFFTGLLEGNSHISPDSVTKDSSLRFSRRGLLLLLPEGETAREGEAEECSILQRFRLFKATACVLETLVLETQGKGSSWWCLVVVEKRKSDWLRCAEERKKASCEKSRIVLILDKRGLFEKITCRRTSL